MANQTRPQAWLAASLTAPRPMAEAFADLITILSGQGVLEEEISPEVLRMTGYLPVDAQLEERRAQLEALRADLGDQAQLSYEELPDQDWHQGWKKYFKPRLVTPHLWVGPPWEEVTLAPGQRHLIIDPGQAFGTGQHETTALCLARVEELATSGHLPARLLDVGAGSGILSLSALQLGVASAVAIDIDPLATEACGHNARLNGLEQKLEISETPLAHLRERFDLILANLTAGDLLGLRWALCAHLNPGGTMILSGILVEQLDQVREAFQEQELKLVRQDTAGPWGSLVMA